MKHEPVVLINAFEVAVADDEAFLQGWERARNSLRTQDGHLSTQLHKSISPAAEFRFVNVARWQSEGAFRVATARPEFSSRCSSLRLPRVALHGRARGRPLDRADAMATMTPGQQRKVQRIVHLVAAVAMLGYVYAPTGAQLQDVVRFLVFPLLAMTGIAIWQAARIRRGLNTVRGR